MRWMPIGDVEEWDRNPRLNDGTPVESVARSILRWGFLNPVTVWKSRGELRAGHTRLKAVRFLQEHRPVHDEDGSFAGWEARPEDDPFWVPAGYDEEGEMVMAPTAASVPVRLVEFRGEEEAAAYAIADNRLNELADWEEPGLAKLLHELSESQVPIDDLGFSADEVAGLLDQIISVTGHTRIPAGDGDPPALQVVPGEARLVVGDCLDHLRGLPDNSVDAIVTDPPYGLSEEPDPVEVLTAWLGGEKYEHGKGGFMGEKWDSFAPGPRVWRECLRVLKPGGHLLCAASTRTDDLMGVAIRLAGFEKRTLIGWLYWSGFPKSMAAVAVDQTLGVADQRLPVGPKRHGSDRRKSAFGRENQRNGWGYGPDWQPDAPASDEAKRFAGYGTALKPAMEPWHLFRKPMEGTLAENLLKWGTGALNIDACRHPPGDTMWPGPQHKLGEMAASFGPTRIYGKLDYTEGDRWHPNDGGRFPSNIAHCSKPSTTERQAGCEAIEPVTGTQATKRKSGSKGLKSPRAGAGRTQRTLHNDHKTVKPIRLMAWLVRLVMPPGRGTCLDPFMGSGTTGIAAVCQGHDFIGYDLKDRHVSIAGQRIAHWKATGIGDIVARPDEDSDEEEADDEDGT